MCYVLREREKKFTRQDVDRFFLTFIRVFWHKVQTTIENIYFIFWTAHKRVFRMIMRISRENNNAGYEFGTCAVINIVAVKRVVFVLNNNGDRVSTHAISKC